MGLTTVSSSTDTTMTNYYSATEDEYISFNTLDLFVGDKMYVNIGGDEVILASISAIASNQITLGSGKNVTTNPGEFIYSEVLKRGYIEPYVKRPTQIHSYPLSKYCGAAIYSSGYSHRAFGDTENYVSESTLHEADTIISLYFEKGRYIDEVRVKVKLGSESDVIKSINKRFREPKDISFSTDKRDIHRDIVNVETVISSNKNSIY